MPSRPDRKTERLVLMLVLGAIMAIFGRPVRTPRRAHSPVHTDGSFPEVRPSGWSAVARLSLLLALGVIASSATAAFYEVRSRETRWSNAVRVTGGDPERGRTLMVTFGCAGCHTIPGVPGAMGLVGPPLGGISRRLYLGGVLTNTPENMISWIENPTAHTAKTAMPRTGISRAEARNAAAYLYTLR
jgi:cytochrome c2